MKFDCESIEFIIKYDDNGIAIRIYIETKEDPEPTSDSGLLDT